MTRASQHTKRRLAWGPLMVLPWLVPFLTGPQWPRWAEMWLLAFTIFCGCKWLTWCETPKTNVSLRRRIGYLLAWPGLDAASFLASDRTASTVQRPTLTEWMFAWGKLFVGATLLYGVARLLPARYPDLVGWVGMIGLVMMLHFGGFHVLSCAWRNAGVDAKPLMNRPLAATSLGEFWGRRWNTAFRDFTHRFLFRPLIARIGPNRAVFAGFAFSGLVHDVVISWPAGGGYSGPTVYFTLQGLGILAERSLVGKKLRLGEGWRGWLFAAIVLIGPVRFLFHRPFVNLVVLPFLQAIGAVS